MSGVSVGTLYYPEQDQHAAAKTELPLRSVRLRLYAFLLLCDCTILLISLVAGALISPNAVRAAQALRSTGIAIPFFAVAAFNRGAYSITALQKPSRGLTRVLTALIYTVTVLVLSIFFLAVSASGLRAQLLWGGSIAAVLLTLERLGVGSIIKRRYGTQYEAVVLLRDGVEIDAMEGTRLLDANSMALRSDTGDPMMLDRIAKALRGVDRVVVACAPEAKRRWATILKGANVRGEIVSDNFDALGSVAINRFAGRPTLVVSTGPLNLHNRLVKRCFDLLLCVPALIALAPVFVLTAAAIKLDSRGPVFFRQQRIGRGNEMFEIFKFRSMRQDRTDAAGHRSAARDDERVTRVGRVIRRLSIDELPQLLNVLSGSMSLVGPRPHALGSLAGDRLFWEVDDRYWHRHALKPGITGLAQVRGFRGATHDRSDLTRRLQADLEYISGWSAWRDLAILLATFRVIFHKNAY